MSSSRLRIRTRPGAEASAKRKLEETRTAVRAELVDAMKQLQAAKRRADAAELEHIETKVLPALLLRARACSLADYPRGIKSRLKVGKVRWSGDEALQHLESLGFRRPTSKQQMQKRVQEFVRKLILDGMGASLPDHLFEIPLSLIATTG